MSDLLPTPQTQLAAIKRGDTWQGLGSVTVKSGAGPMDLTAASVVMQLRVQPRHGKVVAEWFTGLHSPSGSSAGSANSIIITDAANGVFRIEGRIMNVPAGDYAWDIQLTLASGRVLTIAQGTWKILQDVSR